jgi:hypothetical protein
MVIAGMPCIQRRGGVLKIGFLINENELLDWCMVSILILPLP